jgi:hypothetical protein
MKSKRSILNPMAGVLAATFAPPSNPISEPEPTVAAPQKSPPKGFPSPEDFQKMSAQRRAYWQRKMVDATYPAYYRAKRNVQLQSGRVKAPIVEVTRQMARAHKRAENKQPLNVSGVTWQRELHHQRREKRVLNDVVLVPDLGGLAYYEGMEE